MFCNTLNVIARGIVFLLIFRRRLALLLLDITVAVIFFVLCSNVKWFTKMAQYCRAGGDG